MNTDILIRSTAKNWIVSIRKTNARGEIATVPVATRPRKPPQTAGEAILVIEEMRRHTKSKPARIRMAETALSIGNISPGARVVWLTYLAEERS